MVLKKFAPINVDLETHAELVRRKKETGVNLTRQVHVLVLGNTPDESVKKEDGILVPPKVEPAEVKTVEETKPVEEAG